MFRRFDLRTEHCKVTGGAFEVVHQAGSSSRTQDPRRCHFLADVGRADCLGVLAGYLGPETRRFCACNGDTNGVDERLTFIISGARHDGDLAHRNTTCVRGHRSENETYQR